MKVCKNRCETIISLGALCELYDMEVISCVYRAQWTQGTPDEVYTTRVRGQ
jgi:hypothetical protein